MQAAFVTLSKPLAHSDTSPAICKRRPRIHHRPVIWTITSRRGIQKDTQNTPPPDGETPANDSRRRRMPMPPETRKKISDALKGRRKSAEHRESLRRRFEGSQNPMYGRKRSAESRAKISRAMAAKAKQKKSAEQPDKPPVQEEALDQLREKAKESRLITSVTEEPEKRVRRRAAHDELESAHVDRILKRVAKFEQPPESVVRALNSNREKRITRANQRRIENRSQELPPNEQPSQIPNPQPEANKRSRTSEAKNKAHAKCSLCKGTGLMECPRCIISGIPSSRCELCFGAGGVFCDTCNGVGALVE